MITTNVNTWERPCVCFVDAGLELLGCKDKAYQVLNLLIRGIPGCCPRQLVGVESAGKGESVALCELSESSSFVVCLSNAKSSYCPCLVLVCVRVYFGIPIALNYKYILGSLCYDAIKLPVELFDLLAFVA